jgi:MFS family permease
VSRKYRWPGRSVPRVQGEPVPGSAGVARGADEGWLNRLTFTLFSVAVGTNIPTPLLLIYRRTLDLSDAAVTAIFGAYALGLMPALFLAGSSSDRLGRRRVLLPFVVLAAAVSLLFVAAADSVPLLYLARFLQGVVSGVVFSVANAWLQELAGRDRPRLAAARASVAMTGGFAVAPLLGGVLGEWGPAPTTLPYLVHVAVVVVGLVSLRGVPETVTVARRGPLLVLGLPRSARRPFWTVLSPTAVGVYAFPSVAITLLPLLLREGGASVVFTGVLGAVTLGSGTVGAPIGARLGPPAAPLGAALGAAGFLAGLLGVVAEADALLLPAGVLLGVGSGLCLSAGLALTARLAPPETRGAMNSAFFAFAYAGFGAPLLLAYLTGRFSSTVALAGIAGLFALIAGWLAYDLRRV